MIYSRPFTVRGNDNETSGQFYIPVAHQANPASQSLGEPESINPLAKPSRTTPL